MNRRGTILVLTLVILLAGGYFAWQRQAKSGGLLALHSSAAAGANGAATGALSGQDAVLVAYQQRGKALREGDGALWLSLQSRETRDKMSPEQKAAMARFPAQPSAQFVALASAANSRQGAVIGRIDGSTYSFHYEVVKYALEDGGWKIAAESMSENPIDLRSLAALLPPADGAFIRAGLPWAGIPYAELNTKFFKDSELEWKMQATSDESFLYVRWEAKAPLPASGAEMQPDPAMKSSVKSGGPSSPPVMLIRVGGSQANAPAQEFRFQSSEVTQTKATFGENGKATSNRYFAIYQLVLRDDKDGDIFDNNSDDTFTSLVSVQDRFFDVKIPLKSLGLYGKTTVAIELKEVNSLAKILPYAVQPFSR